MAAVAVAALQQQPQPTAGENCTTRCGDTSASSTRLAWSTAATTPASTSPCNNSSVDDGDSAAMPRLFLGDDTVQVHNISTLDSTVCVNSTVMAFDCNNDVQRGNAMRRWSAVADVCMQEPDWT
ncbi:hypothetical protein E2562_010131 [Oryza meyeriana var. granulata]|uniref:Uncharacterized protein n=1 Tax=Oryza meyeriana var. granulata TaxID=110450 RepID=A0A6G1EJ92_9ORYZ|nr:hypothetical protein E2562_010131 [Oryza meyeriana var. granulata]